MGELRAALAIARKDLRTWTRYPISAAGQVFVPLYQGLIPAFLLGATFFVGGQAVGLEQSAGTSDLAGFLFLGGIIGGMVAAAFWGMAFSLRNEMDMGTLEPSWLTPTRRETFVLGRAIASLVTFSISQVVLVIVTYWFFHPRFLPTIWQALPAVLLAGVAVLGVGYLVTAGVMLFKEANFFVDTTNFLFGQASGVSYPVTVLPTVLRAVALALPTTYAMDLMRHWAVGTTSLLDPLPELGVLALLALLAYPLGRIAFARSDRRMRREGTLGQH